MRGLTIQQRAAESAERKPRSGGDDGASAPVDVGQAGVGGPSIQVGISS